MSAPIPTVSFLMPVYNAGRFIDETMDSILAQTFADFELVVIDDGSKDDSTQRLERYAAQDARVKLLSRANRGLVATLNEAINLARGELYARIDADDLCEPRRLELQVARMRAEPELVALGSGALAIDEAGHALGDYSNPLSHEEIERAHLEGYSSIHHPAVMLRAAAVRRVGGYRDLVPCEDFDLWLRLGEVGRLANLPENLIRKRLMTGGLVGSNMEKHDRVLMRILADTWERRRLPGEPKLPASGLSSRGDLYRQWGWMALKHGYVGTSRRYAARAVATEPFRSSSWRLMACAIRGR